MKRLITGAIILHLIIMGDAGYAQKQPEDLLKAVVKVRAVIPDGAGSPRRLAECPKKHV